METVLRVCFLALWVCAIFARGAEAKERNQGGGVNCSYLDWASADDNLPHHFRTLQKKTKGLLRALANESIGSRSDFDAYNELCEEQFAKFSYKCKKRVECLGNVIRRLEAFKGPLQFLRDETSGKIHKPLKKTVHALETFVNRIKEQCKKASAENNLKEDPCHGLESVTSEDTCTERLQTAGLTADSKKEASVVLAHELKKLVKSLQLKKCQRKNRKGRGKGKGKKKRGKGKNKGSRKGKNKGKDADNKKRKRRRNKAEDRNE